VLLQQLIETLLVVGVRYPRLEPSPFDFLVRYDLKLCD
jgi:hypothetical protein